MVFVLFMDIFYIQPFLELASGVSHCCINVWFCGI